MSSTTATTRTTSELEAEAGPAEMAEGRQPKTQIDLLHAVWWGLFAAGGMTAALLVPVHIAIQGVLGPLGLVPFVNARYETFSAALANPLVRLYLFVLISLPFFHAAHRTRFLLIDLGLRRGRAVIAWLLYGAAIVGTVITALVLLTV
jgi:fumarate reductase subunit D